MITTEQNASRTGHDSALEMEHAYEREKPSGRQFIDDEFALQPLRQQRRALIMNASPAHINRLDLCRRQALDRIEVSGTYLEVILDDLGEWRQRQKVRYNRFSVR